MNAAAEKAKHRAAEAEQLPPNDPLGATKRDHHTSIGTLIEAPSFGARKAGPAAPFQPGNLYDWHAAYAEKVREERISTVAISRMDFAAPLLADLHGASIRCGTAATTSIDHSFRQSVARRGRAAPVYYAPVFRSFADSLWHTIVNSSLEYGVEVGRLHQNLILVPRGFSSAREVRHQKAGSRLDEAGLFDSLFHTLQPQIPNISVDREVRMNFPQPGVAVCLETITGGRLKA